MAVIELYGQTLFCVKHILHISFVTLMHQARFCEITLSLRFLFGQNVTFERVLSFNFSRSGELEALLGAGYGFHLWHNLYCFVLIFSFSAD
jgi:hypothetical protein